jgi:hypothetical protein
MIILFLILPTIIVGESFEVPIVRDDPSENSTLVDSTTVFTTQKVKEVSRNPTKLERFLNVTSTPSSTTKISAPVHLRSRSKIRQLLDAIDTRLRNASMMLDSHVVVLHNSNGTVNVTRTWSFQPTQMKPFPNVTVRLFLP